MRKIKRKSYKDIFKRSYAIKLLKNKYLIKGFLKENEKLKINIFQIRGKEIYIKVISTLTKISLEIKVKKREIKNLEYKI
ncbi:hypothetical protein [Cetobacterium sp. ZWU0022]|uniref:hypothetical protein n=1 Tax=Cetobacterium sp. ZWU0022 TaxID=1340502 RepID=UPI0006476720|nr:hypothetical protein [Cetobacterium sp. ZWU0022]